MAGAEPPCGRTILVVEDDADIRDALRLVLEGEGYHVQTADNGKQALERLQDLTSPCLILLDIMMPIMSGIEFLAAMRADDLLAPIPVVVVSAWPNEAAKAKGTTQGFVRKPIDLEILLTFVKRYCPI